MASRQSFIFLASLFITGVLGQTCKDLDTEACKLIASKNPSICSDKCLSSVCQSYCGLCPLRCYSCHEVDDPTNCTTDAVCPTNDHQCFTTQTYTDTFEVVYKMGCATRSICEQNIKAPGNKRSHLDVNGGCCNSDLCNNQLPSAIDLIPKRTTVAVESTTASPSFMSDCSNLDEDVCLRFSLADPYFCTNECIATNICPRMCKKCFKCYNCNDLDKPDKCNQTTTCKADHECFQLETLSFDLRPVFRLGCLESSTCSRFHPHSSQTFGRRQSVALVGGCCRTDLCNLKITQEVATTTTVLPTTPGCTPTILKDGCPIGFTRVGDSCYYLGRHHRNKADAQQECEAVCTRLVIISSEQENVMLSNFLHQSRQLLGIREEGHYWIDAYRSDASYDGAWVWSSTSQTIDGNVYSHWRPGSHPTPNKDGEHCADIGIEESTKLDSSHGYYWDHRSCGHTFSAICEYSLGSQP